MQKFQKRSQRKKPKMRKLQAVLISLILSAACAAGALASEYTLDLNWHYYGAKEYSALYQTVPEVKLKYNMDELYIFFSIEENRLALVGQEAYDITLPALGMGYNYRLNDKFTLFADLGFYYPEYHARGAVRDEGQMYYMNAKVLGAAESRHGKHWPRYSVDRVNGAIGANLGLRYRVNRLSMNLGYRLLETRVKYLGEDPAKGIYEGMEGFGWWQLNDTQSFSGYFVGVQLAF